MHLALVLITVCDICFGPITVCEFVAMKMMMIHIHTHSHTTFLIKADKRFSILEPNMTDNLFFQHFLGRQTLILIHLKLAGTNADHFTKVHLGEKYEFMELLTKPIRDIITGAWVTLLGKTTVAIPWPVLRFRQPKQQCNSMVTISWCTDSHRRKKFIKVYSKPTAL